MRMKHEGVCPSVLARHVSVERSSRCIAPQIYSALHLAAENNRREAVNLLLENHFDPNAKGPVT
jgi:hypothetical protein